MGLDAATGPDADHQKELDKLTGFSGNYFDKAYMKDMISDDSQALNAFTKEAKDTKDAKLRAAVIKGKTAVAAHKTWLMISKRNFSLYFPDTANALAETGRAFSFGIDGGF